MAAHTDNLRRGPEMELRRDSERLGLRADSADKARFRLRECPFFAVALPSGQILWECDGTVNGAHLRELLCFVNDHKQSMHINMGLPGDEQDYFVSKYNHPDINRIYLTMEDISSICARHREASLSFHTVTSQAPPYAPVGANMIVNAWCFSCRYGFADKIDPETGRMTLKKHREAMFVNLLRSFPSQASKLFNDDDIETTLEGYVETKCARTDPEQARTEGVSSDELLDKFLRDPSKKVFLLQGRAGAGKSTLGKKWALELWKTWKPGDRIPLFLHLPKNASVLEYLREQGLDFEGLWTSFIQDKSFLLVLDSFDEMGRKENVVKQVIYEFLGCKDCKVVIACRSDYLQSGGGSEALFAPQASQKSALETFWVCPLDLSNKTLVDKYIDHHVSMSEGKWKKEDYRRALDLLPVLEEIITTPFILKVTLSVLPEVFRGRKEDPGLKITRHNLYKMYTEQWCDREWLKLDGAREVKKKLVALGLDDENYREFYLKASRILASEMHLQNQNHLTYQEGEAIFAREPFCMTWKNKLAEEGGYWLIRGCPTRLRLTRTGAIESVHVSFVHDTLRSFFLSEESYGQVMEQDKGAAPPVGLLLSLGLMNERTEEIKEHVDLVLQDMDYKQKLFDCVRASQTRSDEQTLMCAANAATILVAARESFAGLDLREIKIAGASLRNGIFHRTDLRGADLSRVDGSHGFFSEARLEGADLSGMILREYPVLRGHTSGVKSVAYSTDGKQLASGSDDGTVRLWEASSGTCLLSLRGHTDRINGVAYSPDGKQLASGSDDKTVRIWDASSGARIRALRGHTGGVCSVAYSPDGKQLASGSRDGTVRVWDACSRACMRTLQGHAGEVCSVMYSPDGKKLASGSGDATVRVWEAHSGVCMRTLPAHAGGVCSVVYSPDGKQLVSGSDDGNVRVWEASSGTLMQTLRGYTGGVKSVAYSPDGKQLASGSWEYFLPVWEAGSGTSVRTLQGHTSWIESVAYSPDGKQLATGSEDGTVRVWEASSGTLLQTLRGHTWGVESVAYSPDGKQLASGSVNETVRVWEASSGAHLLSLRGHTSEIYCTTYSPDGKQLASGSMDGHVQVWEASSGALVQTLQGHTTVVKDVTYSPDGKQLASGSGDKTVRIWDASSGTCLQTLQGHTSWIKSIAYSPDGKQLASGAEDDTVRVWDASSGACVRTLQGHTGWIESVMYSPDGKQLASRSRDGTLRVWDPCSGACLQTLQGHTHLVESMAYSSDGKQLASGSWDETVRVWDTCSGACLQTLQGHKGGVNTVAYSPEGRQLASGSVDGTVRVWDACRGVLVQTLLGHTGGVKIVAYSPDGKQLASGSEDKTVKIWECRRDGCWYLVRDLSGEERSLFFEGCCCDRAIVSAALKALLLERGALGNPEEPRDQTRVTNLKIFDCALQ